MNFLDDYTRDLYRDILKRQPAPGEIAGWLQAYDAGTVSPSGVAGLILNSQEAKVDFVQQEFQALLGRTEDPADANALANYSSREALILTLVSSPEYYKQERRDPGQLRRCGLPRPRRDQPDRPDHGQQLARPLRQGDADDHGRLGAPLKHPL